MKDGEHRTLITEKTTQTMMDTFLLKQGEKNRTRGPVQIGQLQYKLALFEQVNETRWPSEISYKVDFDSIGVFL